MLVIFMVLVPVVLTVTNPAFSKGDYRMWMILALALSPTETALISKLQQQQQVIVETKKEIKAAGLVIKTKGKVMTVYRLVKVDGK